MIKERREHFRYPTWLPGTVSWGAAGSSTHSTTEVRVVDWSMGGASIDGVVDGGIDDVMGHAGAPLTLRIAWGGLELDIAARIVSGETAGEFPVTHLRFEHLTAAQELEIAALVGAKAAAFKEGQRGLLQYLASADS